MKVQSIEMDGQFDLNFIDSDNTTIATVALTKGALESKRMNTLANALTDVLAVIASRPSGRIELLKDQQRKIRGRQKQTADQAALDIERLSAIEKELAELEQKPDKTDVERKP